MCFVWISFVITAHRYCTVHTVIATHLIDQGIHYYMSCSMCHRRCGDPRDIIHKTTFDFGSALGKHTREYLISLRRPRLTSYHHSFSRRHCLLAFIMSPTTYDDGTVLAEILSQLNALRQSQQTIQTKVCVPSALLLWRYFPLRYAQTHPSSWML